MYFKRLKINYFGRFHNKELEFQPGINIVYGENEAGKSTVHNFIKGMLFGIERMRGRAAASKEDTYTRYLPWDYPGAYNGSMDIMTQEKEYRLQRSFHSNDKNFTMIDLETGREIKLKEGHISELIPGLTESTFKNTISIEQLKAQTDTELAAQVRNYIANLSIAKSKEVNVGKAVSLLNDQRKAFDSSQHTSELKALQLEIEDGMEREEHMDELTMQLRTLLGQEKDLTLKKAEVTSSMDNEEAHIMEQFPAILEKYRSYRDNVKQSNQLEEQMKQLQEQISDTENDSRSMEALKNDIIEIEKLNAQLQEYSNNQMLLQNEMQDLKQSNQKKSLIFSILAAGIVLLISFLLSGVIKIALGAAVSVITAFIVFLLFKALNNKKIQELLDRRGEMELFWGQTQSKVVEVLQRNQVVSVAELSFRLDETTKKHYALGHISAQLSNIERRKNEIDDHMDILYDSIMKYMDQFITEDTLSDSSMLRLQEEIKRRKQHNANHLSEINQQYETCKLRIEKIKWELSRMEGNEEKLLRNRARYDELNQKLQEDTVELDAIKLALGTIQELSVDIHDSFGRELNLAISDIIREITGGKYTDIKVDEKLDIKVEWNGNYISLDRLSAGTIDQVYFALRLAIAELLLAEEVPLLLDDSFALYDENRLKTVIEHMVNRNQIILFTCHKREQKLLKELGLPYHFIDLSAK